MSAGDRLAIIVVSYNSHELLATHQARTQLGRVPARVIVVDNSEAAAERGAAEAVCDEQWWDYLPALGNVGFGAGHRPTMRHYGPRAPKRREGMT